MSRASVAALSAYLLLASTRWLLDALFSSSLSFSESSALASSFLCIAVLFFRSGARSSETGNAWIAGIPGALLFACAWVLSNVVGGGLPGFTRLALFSLVPVGIVVIAAARGSGRLDFLSCLTASLAGVGGMFLLLPADPEAMLSRPVALASVLGAIGGLSVGSYLVYPAIRELSLRAATLLLLAPLAVLNAVAALARHTGFRLPAAGDLPALGWQAVETALLVSLLRTVPPLPLSARFLLVPLLGAVGGFVAVRPPLTWRLVVGAGLLLSGSVRLLRERSEGQDSSLSLL